MDQYMPDGGQYRFRRFGRFIYDFDKAHLTRRTHAAFFQSREMNSFVGGVAREFPPLQDSTAENPALIRLLNFDLDIVRGLKGERTSNLCELQVHQIRISPPTAAPVCPTPEGMHSDGHDFLIMHLIQRYNVEGAESLLMQDTGEVERHTLENPLETIVVDDRRVQHSVTMMRRAEDKQPALRDMLLIDINWPKSLLE